MSDPLTTDQRLTTAQIQAAMERYAHVKEGDIYKLLTELVELRAILSEAAPVGIETNCDECGGDNDKCFEGCWVRRARKAGINADTDEPMEWV